MADQFPLPSPREAARALGGECQGVRVLCPGPGHSTGDRSLSIRFDAGAPDGFLVHSFAGQDPLACRDHVRHLLGLPEFGIRRPVAPIDHAAIARRRAEAEARAKDEAEKQIGKARWLWGQTRPIMGTPAETYLRTRRGIEIVPAALRFLPARDTYPPSMVAAYGMSMESEPGAYDTLPPRVVKAVHITRLRPDGSGKAPDSEGKSKIMVGPTRGQPIALIPVNDLGGLAIAEGIETALSLAHTGLGIWAAGSAGALPALAPLIASLPYIEAVTIAADQDDHGEGERRAAELAQELCVSRPDVETFIVKGI